MLLSDQLFFSVFSIIAATARKTEIKLRSQGRHTLEDGV